MTDVIADGGQRNRYCMGTPWILDQTQLSHIRSSNWNWPNLNKMWRSQFLRREYFIRTKDSNDIGTSELEFQIDPPNLCSIRYVRYRLFENLELIYRTNVWTYETSIFSLNNCLSRWCLLRMNSQDLPKITVGSARFLLTDQSGRWDLKPKWYYLYA